MQSCSINYCGGLGNQLFQLFTVMSYSIDTGKNLVLKHSEYSPSITQRPTYWNSVFKELKNILTTDDIKMDYFYREYDGFTYKPIPFLKDSSSIELDGYYQSYKYFHHNLQQIKKILCMEEQITEVKNKYPEILNGQYSTIAVHFRLGDYKNLQQHHPLLPISYYVKAVEHIVSRIETGFKIIYFCEDEDDAFINHNYIPLLSPLVKNISKCPKDMKDYEEMYIMSLCDWCVIANSTFSWWGAYLKEVDRHKVIYPKRWFFNPTSPDLVLETWTGM